MADHKQKNILKPSLHLKKIISRQSMPHVSRVTKIKRHNHSLEKQVKSHSTSFKAFSIIHTTIGMPKKDEYQTNKSLVDKENNLHSFSSIQSIHQRQNILRSSNLIPSNSNKTQKTPSHRSITQSQLNQWNNDDSNENVEPSYNFISTQQYSHRDDDHQQPWIKQNSFKPTKIAQSEATKRFKNDHSTILNETKKKKERKHFNKHFPSSCSMRCILLSLLMGLLLIGAIIGIIVGILIPSKTTTTSITLTTTAVITTACSCLCTNESWTFDSDRLARWSFDGTLADITNYYNATSINNPSFVTNGYVNQALFFNASRLQSLSTSYIPLAYTSFTIEVWLKPTLFPNLQDHSILGLCPIAAPHQCLHLVIRTINSNRYLYFGFFADDCQGNTSLILNQWIHAAFVFDITALSLKIYLNGILDNRCIASAPVMATMGSITIGTIPAIIPLINMNFYQGYMDHLTITKRVKSSCEILEDATLASCFLFNAATPYTDSGPNSLPTSEVSTSIISSGHSHEAISFNSTSYFQASSFTALGTGNKSFSIILWIRPRSVLGTILHVSSLLNGRGWCIPFLGIAANGSVVAQISNAGAVTIRGPSIPMSPVWSHIVQTWSSTNGLRLYINSTLVAFDTSAVIYPSSGVPNFVTLANSRNGSGSCIGGGLGVSAPGPLNCDIDDFRLYSRELTASDISTIYYSR